MIESNIKEIENDSVLRYYGALIGLTLFINWINWQFYSQSGRNDLVSHILSSESLLSPICWPFFDSCHKYRIFSQLEINYLLYFFGIVSCFITILFCFRRFVRISYALLVFELALKMSILFQDFRLRKNQHYMNIWVIVVFLFVPQKRQVLQYLIVAFYFFAGLLKLNIEWLSGAAIYNRANFLIPDGFLVTSMGFVVVLELVISFWLLSQSNIRFIAALVCYLSFHIVGYSIVGFYYPLLMLTIMSIFILIRMNGDSCNYLSLLFQAKASVSTYLTLGIFSFMQLIPIAIPGDSALTGEGRMFALHMFDAKPVCDWKIQLKFVDQLSEPQFSNSEVPTNVRVRCDPLVVYSLAKAQCRKFIDDGRFLDLDVYLKSRRTTDYAYHTILDIEDFCHRNLKYRVFWKNEWIGR